MDNKLIFYIILFVGMFLYSLVKDTKKELRKKQDSDKSQEVPDLVGMTETEEPRTGNAALDDSIRSLENSKRRSVVEEPARSQEERMEQPRVMPRNLHRSEHNHQEVAHHHQETKASHSPQRNASTESSSPFLSVEDELFSDTIEAVTLEGFEQGQGVESTFDVEKECPLRSVEDARRAFVYSEIWNRKYC